MSIKARHFRAFALENDGGEGRPAPRELSSFDYSVLNNKPSLFQKGQASCFYTLLSVPQENFLQPFFKTELTGGTASTIIIMAPHRSSKDLCTWKFPTRTEEVQ